MNTCQNRPSRELIAFAEAYVRNQGGASGSMSWEHLSGDGSDRRLYRLTFNNGPVIVVVNDHPPANNRGITENDSFYYIGHHLKAKGIGTPDIYAYQREKGWFILEDLGDVHLHDEAIKIKHDPIGLGELYNQVLDLLPMIQVKGAQEFDTNKIHSVHYDTNFVRQWESGYFFRSFLKGYLHLDISEDMLNDEFNALADHLTSINGGFFLYRDFQSKNIMIKENQIRFLDFQGGRMGPLHYDLSSLLLDPYVNIPNKLRQTLMEYYLKRLATLIPIDQGKFLSDYYVIALHRNMQILGAFGHLSAVKKRLHFKRYIPTATNSLKELLTLHQFSPYKNLRKVVETL